MFTFVFNDVSTKRVPCAIRKLLHKKDTVHF